VRSEVRKAVENYGTNDPKVQALLKSLEEKLK
jgi:hypothetical protein